MRKKVTYIVKVITTISGEILQAACECPSGTGPRASCKHVCAVALAVATLRTGEVQIYDENLCVPLCAILPTVFRQSPYIIRALRFFKASTSL